jgi:hypothetical protein
VYVYFLASLIGEQYIVAGHADYHRKDEEVRLMLGNGKLTNYCFRWICIIPSS